MRKPATPQQDFWENPRQLVEGLDPVRPDFVGLAKPEGYVHLYWVSNYLCSVVEFYGRSLSILELGCGPGRNLQMLYSRGHDPYGIEINPDALLVAQKEFPEIVKRIKIGAVEDLLPKANIYDVILTSGFLMHLPPESENVFDMMIDRTRLLLIVNEVENTREIMPGLRFPRNYGDVFRDRGLKEIATITYMNIRHIRGSTTRVFIKKK